MKKVYGLILSLFLLILAGCSATPVRTEVLSKTQDIVKVEVIQLKRTAVSPLDGGIQLSIENLTDKVLEIDWNSSSLDGDAIVISGQLFIQKNTLLPKTVIAPYSKTIKAVNKSTNIVSFMGNWEEHTLELPCKLVLHVTIDDKEEYVIINLIEKIK